MKLIKMERKNKMAEIKISLPVSAVWVFTLQSQRDHSSPVSIVRPKSVSTSRPTMMMNTSNKAPFLT